MELYGAIRDGNLTVEHVKNFSPVVKIIMATQCSIQTTPGGSFLSLRDEGVEVFLIHQIKHPKREKPISKTKRLGKVSKN